MVRPTRRAVLTLGSLCLAGSGAGLLSGCSAIGGSASAATTEVDTELEEAAVDRAVAAVQELWTGASSLASGTLPDGSSIQLRGETARLVKRVLAIHRSQLTQLGSPVADSSTSASADATDSAESEGSTDDTVDTTSDTTGTAQSTAATGVNIASPAALAKAEWQTARACLRDGAGLAPEFALLIYRIAAACATDADLLRTAVGGDSLGTLKPAAALTDSSTTTDDSTDDSTDGLADTTTDSDATDGTQDSTAGPEDLTEDETDALNRLLAGEHAAFYAYPLVIAHVDDDHRSVAEALWEAHQDQRDALERLLVGAGETPVAAAAAYAVTTPATPAKAVALATKVERRLAGLAADVIAVAEDSTVQSTAADLLVLAARRQAAWSNRPVADPGS